MLKRRCGFTLVELLLTLALLATMSAIAVPNLAQWVQAQRVRAATESLQAELQLARSRAVATNGNSWLSLDVDRNTWTVECLNNACEQRSGVIAPTLALALQRSGAINAGQPGANPAEAAAGALPRISYDTLGRPAADPQGRIDQIEVRSGQNGPRLILQLNPNGTVRICNPAAAQGC